MAVGSMDVRVENQLVRFVCPTPVNHDQVVSEVGGQRNSGVVIKALDRPRATLVIDEEGRLLASGTSGIPGFFGDRDFALLRLLPDGTPDPLFGTNGLTTTTFGTAFDDANALVITPENKAVLVGMSAQTNNDFAIARYILGPVIDGVEESVALFSVYPNPTDNVLYIAHSENLTEWCIRTPLGQTIEAGALDQPGQMTLDLSHIPSGAYVLTLETPYGPQTQRIFVQH